MTPDETLRLIREYSAEIDPGLHDDFHKLERSTETFWRG